MLLLVIEGLKHGEAKRDCAGADGDFRRVLAQIPVGRGLHKRPQHGLVGGGKVVSLDGGGICLRREGSGTKMQEIPCLRRSS